MKMAPAYARRVIQAAYTVLDVIEQEGPLIAKPRCLRDEVHSFEQEGWEYRVTSNRKSRWRGKTMTGALTALTAEGMTAPIRVWHVSPEGKRVLVLLDDGDPNDGPL